MNFPRAQSIVTFIPGACCYAFLFTTKGFPSHLLSMRVYTVCVCDFFVIFLRLRHGSATIFFSIIFNISIYLQILILFFPSIFIIYF